jgi:DNA-binding protein HU-beta
MNTAELADKVAAEHDLSKAEAKRMVETVLTTIAHTAGAGEEVSLAGFGKFKIGERAARQGRNPATGAQIEIAASRKLSFIPAKQLRDALNPVGGGGAKASKAQGTAAKGRTGTKTRA